MKTSRKSRLHMADVLTTIRNEYIAGRPGNFGICAHIWSKASQNILTTTQSNYLTRWIRTMLHGTGDADIYLEDWLYWKLKTVPWGLISRHTSPSFDPPANKVRVRWLAWMIEELKRP